MRSVALHTDHSPGESLHERAQGLLMVSIFSAAMWGLLALLA